MRLLCVHGFLGGPEDFGPLRAALAAEGCTVPLEAVDLWPWAGRRLSMGAVAETLAALGRPGDVLLGYSLGGRLAAQAFVRPSSPFAALVTLSAHPGGLAEAERSDRCRRDGQWAARFLGEPLPAVLAAWNAQPVFTGSSAPPRLPEDVPPRAALAWALEAWSVADQPDLRPVLAAERRPVLLLAGAKDARYATLVEGLARALPRGRARVLPGAGHRLPWDAPAPLAAELVPLLAPRKETPP